MTVSKKSMDLTPAKLVLIRRLGRAGQSFAMSTLNFMISVDQAGVAAHPRLSTTMMMKTKMKR
jgi:methylphosphotriester-DNA--protein-cysteine methyltransferase